MKGITFARNLWELTPEELAQKIGLSRTIVSLWENGKKTIPEKRQDELEKILCINKNYLEKELTSVDKILIIAEMEERKIGSRVSENMSELINSLDNIYDLGASRTILENIQTSKILWEVNDAVNDMLKKSSETTKKSYAELLYVLLYYIKPIQTSMVVDAGAKALKQVLQNAYASLLTSSNNDDGLRFSGLFKDDMEGNHAPKGSIRELLEAEARKKTE